MVDNPSGPSKSLTKARSLRNPHNGNVNPRDERKKQRKLQPSQCDLHHLAGYNRSNFKNRRFDGVVGVKDMRNGR
jgi:hypothetical protein